MTLKQQQALARNGDFKLQVNMAMIKAGLDVVGETPKSPVNTDLDDARHLLGVDILDTISEAPNSLVIRFSHACAANDNLDPDQTQNSDADVQFTVNTIFDDMAGVSGAVAGA